MDIALFCLIWIGIGFITALQLETSNHKEEIDKESKFTIVFLWPITLFLYLFLD